MDLQAENNPYSAPQALPVAEPAESERASNELPCHYCGKVLALKATRCPQCGSRRQFERLQLILSGILIAGVMGGYVMITGRGRDTSRWELLPVFLAATFTITPLLGWCFRKIGGNKW